MSQNAGTEVDRIVADVLRLDVDELSDDDEFGEDIPAESLDYVEIAETIDMELGVSVPDEELEEFETVGDVKAFVSDHS